MNRMKDNLPEVGKYYPKYNLVMHKSRNYTFGKIGITELSSNKSLISIIDRSETIEVSPKFKN
jgi:hypothetical protein